MIGVRASRLVVTRRGIVADEPRGQTWWLFAAMQIGLGQGDVGRTREAHEMEMRAH
jgi:hypothetical protein